MPTCYGGGGAQSNSRGGITHGVRAVLHRYCRLRPSAYLAKPMSKIPKTCLVCNQAEVIYPAVVCTECVGTPAAVLALVFGSLIVFLVTAGSLWIMTNLNDNMMHGVRISATR